jgi:hypothetical protein
MSTPIDCTSLDKGDIRFYDNYLPTLEVGDYLINVAQRINPAHTSINDCYTASQPFSVQGPRYTLPVDDIFSVFPPRNSLGVFDQCLPHVVMTNRDSPWERDVFNDEEKGSQTPWIALLLFTEDEVQLNAGGPGRLLIPDRQTGTPNQTLSAIIPAADFYASHTGTSMVWPDMKKEWYETDDFLQSTNCSVIDISPEAFTTLIPSKTDLQYLAHVRQVDTSDKDNEVLKINGEGWYSVVVGNRLPAALAVNQLPKRHIVHLVSLEGFAGYINGTTQFGSAAQRVRMISFESWTFTSHPELSESFSDLMQGLLWDKTVKPRQPKTTSLVLPVTAPIVPSEDEQYAYQSIQNGYVPLRYQTRLRDQSFGWYRGPFSPIAVKNFISSSQQTPNAPTRWQPFDNASSALIYDKNRGLFDVSYGVAWETGRLMALSDSYFGQELLDWQRKGHRLIDLLLERKSQIDTLKSFDPNDPDPTTEKDLLDQIKHYAVTGNFMTYLITQFSTQIAPKLYGDPHDPPAAPFPAFPDAPSPKTTPQSVADLLTDADVQTAIREVGGKELDDLADWLARLYLLIGVPFENLLPHGVLLPTESVRFFYLDSNWLDALVEGALSIGIESSRDRFYQDLMKDLIWDTTFAALQKVRDSLLNAPLTTPSGSAVAFDQASLSGMLLRSAVVSGWPGLEINGYTGYTVDGNGAVKPSLESHIKLLRMEPLSNDVMLCLWPTVPAVITIDEPHEGVAFGFEDPPAGEGDYLYLRSIDPSNYGTPLPGDHGIDATTVIDSATRIIRISAAGGLLDSMKSKLPNSPDIRVRDFAVQMIKVPEQAVFASQSVTGGTGNG